MFRYFGPLLGAFILALTFYGWQLKRERDALTRGNAALLEASRLQAGELLLLRRARESVGRAAALAARENRRLAERARCLEHQLEEAISNDQNFNYPVPDRVALDLCRLWHAASGRGADNAAAAPAAAAGGATHPPAAACADWLGGRLTLADLTRWLALLLEHAGAQRADKAALRAWSAARNRS